MGNYHSSFEFPLKRELAALSWDVVLHAWKQADAALGEKHNDRTTITRAQFIEYFTDSSKATEDGLWQEAPLALFRGFDFGFKNCVALYQLFSLLCLFCQPASASGDTRWQWILRNMFGKGAADDPDDNVTLAEVTTAVATLNRALILLGVINRPCESEELKEVAHGVLWTVGTATNNGRVQLLKLSKWLQTEEAMHALLTRFTMEISAYEKKLDSGGLAPLIPLPDSGSFGRGSRQGLKRRQGLGQKRTVAEVDAAKQKAIAAVSSRAVMADLSFRTGLSTYDVLRLKREFSASMSTEGTLQREGFIQEMTRYFPKLAEEEAVAGEATPHALSSGVRDVHHSTLDRLFDAFDSDGSDSIEFREFVLSASKMAKGSVRDKTDLLFGLLDGDGDGSVTIPELARFVEGGSMELTAIFEQAHSAVHSLQSRTPGALTETDFVTYMLSDPVFPGWFSSITHSASLSLINKALDDIAMLLSGVKGTSVPGPTTTQGRRNSLLALAPPAPPASLDRRQSVHGATLGAPSSSGRRPSAVPSGSAPAGADDTAPVNIATPFKFHALIGFWSERLMALVVKNRKAAGNAGTTVANTGRLAVRSGLPGGPNGDRRPEALLMLKDTCSVDDVITMLENMFSLSDYKPLAIQGVKSACRFLFESLAAAASPATSVINSVPHSSLSSILLPVRLVLYLFGLALARTPEELALVLYREADTDDDGTLTSTELQRYLTAQHAVSSSTLSSALSIISKLDVDGDGLITEAEFRNGCTTFPALFEAFGVLLGGSGRVGQRQDRRAYPAPVPTRPVTGKAGSGVQPPLLPGHVELNATGPQHMAGVADPPAAEYRFVGLSVMGIGQGEAGATSKLSLEERLTLRRQQYMTAGIKVETNLAHLSKQMHGIVMRVRPAVDATVKRMAIQVQKDKAAIHITRQMLKSLDEEKAAGVVKALPARPAIAGTGRPGTAGTHGGRPGTASGIREKQHWQRDRNGVPLVGKLEWKCAGPLSPSDAALYRTEKTGASIEEALGLE